MKQVEIDKSLSDLNIPVFNFDNEIITLENIDGTKIITYNPKSLVIRIYAIEDSVICDTKNNSLEIYFLKGSIEYVTIKSFKLKKGHINIVNI